MGSLLAQWGPLVPPGDFLELPLAQLHKTFHRRIPAGHEGSASLEAPHFDHLLLSRGLDPRKCPVFHRLLPRGSVSIL